MMVRASAAGVIDFTTCDDSERWWRAARLKLRSMETQQLADVAKLRAQRWIALQAAQNVQGGLAELQKRAVDAIDHVERTVMPWVHTSRAVGQDPRDVMLLWYREFAPDLLEQALQELGIASGSQ